MTKTQISTQRSFIQAITLFCIAMMMFFDSAQAATVDYTLDNVIEDNGQQMTGTFQWDYVEGDFENGTFTDLFIPGHGTDIGALTINFDIKKSIEFSLTANLHGQGVNVSLFLASPLTPTQSALLDLGRSSYEIERTLDRGGFVSGAITPVVVPLPAAAWLFT